MSPFCWLKLFVVSIIRSRCVIYLGTWALTIKEMFMSCWIIFYKEFCYNDLLKYFTIKIVFVAMYMFHLSWFPVSVIWRLQLSKTGTEFCMIQTMSTNQWHCLEWHCRISNRSNISTSLPKNWILVQIHLISFSAKCFIIYLYETAV